MPTMNWEIEAVLHWLYTRGELQDVVWHEAEDLCVTQALENILVILRDRGLSE